MTQAAGESSEVIDTLTERQAEMLTLLAEGLTGKEIAGRLRISYSAVSQRIETLRKKFGGVTKNELARMYREHLATGAQEPCTNYTGKKKSSPVAEAIGR